MLPILVLGVSFMVFALLGLLSPSQRAGLYVTNLPKTADGVQRVIERYGLDDPMPVQYVRWLGHVARGDLGFSKTGKEPVADVIRHHAPVTVELALWSFVPIVAVGIGFGVVAAVRHNQPTDQALRAFSTIGTSTPYYLIGLLALMLFAARLGWLPAGDRLSAENQILVASARWRSPTDMVTVDALLNGRLDVFVDGVRHLVLPVVTLALVSWAYLLRVTRSSMLETLGHDYIRTARAKGLGPRPVVWRHAWRNARLPVVTVAGMLLLGLLGGVAMVESVFNLPGLGSRFVDAAVNLDVVTTLGLTLFFAVVLVAGNLVVDLLYVVLDPRVRLS